MDFHSTRSRGTGPSLYITKIFCLMCVCGFVWCLQSVIKFFPAQLASDWSSLQLTAPWEQAVIFFPTLSVPSSIMGRSCYFFSHAIRGVQHRGKKLLLPFPCYQCITVNEGVDHISGMIASIFIPFFLWWSLGLTL